MTKTKVRVLAWIGYWLFMAAIDLGFGLVLTAVMVLISSAVPAVLGFLLWLVLLALGGYSLGSLALWTAEKVKTTLERKL